MTMNVPIDVWIRIAQASPCGPHGDTDEHVFNLLARAVPELGRWTIGVHCSMSGHTTVNTGYTMLNTTMINSTIINRRLDLMLMFGYNVELGAMPVRCGHKHTREVQWNKNGRLHRNDQPAIAHEHTRVWYYHGKQHRTDGPAVQEGERWFVWLRHGARHRINGPADMYDTICIEWCKYGKHHRIDGPAMIYNGGDQEWYVEGLVDGARLPNFYLQN